MKIKDLVLKEIKGFWGEEPAENEKGIPVIKTNNLTYEGVINYSDLCYRSIDVNKVKDNFLINGDLLIEKSGGTKTHSVGYVSYFDGTDNTYVCNNFILGLRINENIVRPKYVFYILKYMYENGYFAHCYKQTTGIQNLKKDLYLDFDIQVPDFQTQDNIINILDKITASTTKDQQKLKKYDDLIKSQFIEMFGDPLSNNLFELHELNTVCDVRDGTHDSPKYHDIGYPLITSKNIIDGGISFEDVNLISKEDYDKINQRSFVDNGDVLMPMIGTIGNPVIVDKIRDFAIKNVALIKFYKDSKIDNHFLYYLMKSDSFNHYLKDKNKGGTQKFVSLGIIRKIKIIVPPIELQNQLADFVKHIDKLKFTIKQSVEKLELCYKSLMKQYFE